MTRGALGSRRSALGDGLGRLRVGVVAVAAALAVGACGGDAGPRAVAARLEALTDTALLVPAGTDVALPPAVRALDRDSNAVRGVTVRFVLDSGGGAIGGGTQTTDSGGVARLTTWTVDTAVGTDNVVRATVSGASPAAPLRFHALSTGDVQYGLLTHNPPRYGQGVNGGNTFWAEAIRVPHAITLRRLTLYLDTAYVTSHVVVGLYDSGSDGLPRRLLAADTSGAWVTSVHPGPLRIPVANIQLQPGTYWLAFDSDNLLYWPGSSDSTQAYGISMTYSTSMPDSFPSSALANFYPDADFTVYVEGTVP